MLYIYLEALFSGSSSPTSKIDKEGELRIFRDKKESRKAESSLTFRKQESRKAESNPASQKQESSTPKVCFIHISRGLG